MKCPVRECARCSKHPSLYRTPIRMKEFKALGIVVLIVLLIGVVVALIF